MTDIDHRAELTKAGAFVEGWWGSTMFFARRYPLGAAGAVIMTIFVLSAIFANFIAPLDPLQTNSKASLGAPDGTYLLGADMMGRDLLSRIIHGARVSLIVAVASTVLGGVIGVLLGLMSGYLLGWFDLITQRVIDIMQALPLLVMALVMAASLGPSIQNTVIAISIPLVPHAARVVRSSTLSLREMPFVEAARAAGMTELRIALRHILPNTLAPLIVLTPGRCSKRSSACSRHNSARRSWSRRRCPSWGWAFPNPIRPGAGCCRSRRHSISTRRRGS